MKAQSHNLPTWGMESGRVRTQKVRNRQRSADPGRGGRAGRWNSSGAGGFLLRASLPASPGHPSPQPRKLQDRLGRQADGTSLSGAVGQACRAGQPLGSLHAGKRGRAGLVMRDEDGVMGCIGGQGRLGGGPGRYPFLMLTSPQHSPCPLQHPSPGTGSPGTRPPLSQSFTCRVYWQRGSGSPFEITLRSPFSPTILQDLSPGHLCTRCPAGHTRDSP